jgi:hypothetical protein
MRIVPAAILLLTALRGSARADVTVTVEARTNVVLGQQGEIASSMFGITAFEGFPAVIADQDYRARVAALRPGCFRFGGSVAWFAPKEDALSWYDTPEAKSAFETTLLFGARYPFGRFLPVVRSMEAEPMVSLGGPPPYLMQEGTDNPSDFDKWAQYCAAHVGLWKRFDPQLRLVQVWNEPNASWYKDPRANDRGTSAADLHVEMANKVAKAIKARFPDIQIGGPVLCWPPAWPPAQTGQRPWYTFDAWTRPWLRGTKNTVDFFDFHVYNVSPDDFAVQTEMVYNEALLTQGRELPIWITESSYNLADDELNNPTAIWSKRMLPYERLLLRGMLPQTDKLAGNLYHDLHAKHHTLLPGDPFQPDPAYWLLWILRDLRGTRVVADSSDPELLAYAALEEDRVTVVLFNDSETEKAIQLGVSMPTGYWTGPHCRSIGQDAQGTCTRLALKPELQRNGGTANGTFQLPGFATVSLDFRMQNFAKPSSARVTREYFGDKTLQFLKPDDPVTLRLNTPAAAGAKAWLRIGLLGPEGNESLRARLNGAALELKPTALQDLPLDASTLKPGNTLGIELAQPADNPKLAVGFASIVLETIEPARR